jgi:hypothetical protein
MRIAAGMRRNAAVVLIAVLVHAVLVFSYPAERFDTPALYFYPRAHAVAHGAHAYGELGYEYPAATIPLLVAPLAVGDSSAKAYDQHTMWLYGAIDVGCVLLIGYILRGRPQREVVLALGLYSVSVIALGKLALSYFDLAVGLAILLAGCQAGRPGRAGAWLGLAGALKLVPLAAVPALASRGSLPRLVAVAAAVPLAAQVAYVLWTGEAGLSWISYHAGRNPEIESWAAVLIDIAHGLGVHARISFDHGSWNVAGGSARLLGRLFALASVVAASVLAVRARRVAADPALALLAALALLVTLAPVLSPEYLLWIAPLSALLASRYPLQACLLASAAVLTRVELRLAFDGLQHFESSAVILLAIRNVVLAAAAWTLWRAATARQTAVR